MLISALWEKGEKEANVIVFYYSVKLKLDLCNNMFCICINIWNKDGEQKKKKIFFLGGGGGGVKLGFFFWNWEKTYFLALGMGPNFGPEIGWSRALRSFIERHVR